MQTQRKPPGRATPSPAAPEVATAPETASAPPSADPGPPPKAPAPPVSAHPHVLRLWEVALAVQDGAQTGTGRENVLALSIFRAPPEVARYKAEVLAWIDELERFVASNT